MANENKTTGINWSKLAVRDGGAIDIEATLALVRSELELHMDGEIDNETVGEAVSGALRNLLGDSQKASTDMNALSVKALNLLGDSVPDGATTSVQNRIKEFVRSENRKFISSNGAEGMCFIGKGRLHGGVNVATPKFVEEYRANQAKKSVAAAK